MISLEESAPAARMATVPVTAEQKMKPEELIAKHLESIGTTEARAAARNRIITGISELTLKQGYKVVEEFSDFKEENGLTLPHTYKFELRVTSDRAPILLDWVLNLQKFSFNQSLTRE